MATSQNGWLVFTNSTDPNLIAISKIAGRVRKGDVEVIFDHLVAWFDKYIEDVDEGEDEWGYSYRPIRGQSSGFSNHASGTAIDLNAMVHPRGKSNTFESAQQAAIRRQMSSVYDDVVRWGGSYDPRLSKIDDMHFEINASASEVKRIADTLRKVPEVGVHPVVPVKTPTPPKPAPAKTVKANSGNSKAGNIRIAKALNAMGYDAGYPDGIPGARLKAGVKAYQKAQKFPKLVADGDWGPATQAHYNWVKDLQGAVSDWAASNRIGSLVEDGDYGSTTLKHVKAVQKDNMGTKGAYTKAGGKVADGLAGSVTCKMLGIPKHP